MNSTADLIREYKELFAHKNEEIRELHRNGASGYETAKMRSQLMDEVLVDLSEKAGNHGVTFVATGGYGRQELHPASDIDLLFLCTVDSHKLPTETKELITSWVTLLFDIGLQVGQAVRSISECIKEANRDNTIKTSMLNTRLVTGDRELLGELESRFQKQCIVGKEAEYLQVRMADFHKRHEKWGETVFLQEPHIKEGCGGLRDFQNILWIIKVRHDADDLQYLVEQKLLTKIGYRSMIEAHEFLMRVRNEMHYSERTDILTLRLQGVVATNLKYPERTILRRIESFMRDYYQHTRAIANVSTSLLQAFDLLAKEEKRGIVNYLAKRRKKREEFDGFVSRDGLLFPQHSKIFEEDPNRIMRTFVHLQRRELHLSPQIRKLFREVDEYVDRAFLYHKDNRSAFEEILSHKGEVAWVLREMHRVGFLGIYLPEFGALELLVQHEFFHRYTADEHTLKCIDVLDSLMSANGKPGTEIFQQLFKDLEDPYVLYLALILHDTGRAENQEFHDDASVNLAAKVCNRLQIKGHRRQRLLFLVDHHLTLFRTATKKDVGDPETIEEFAQQMQTRTNMETLYLFTYVDSNGTNDEAWSAWKASLMQQLYRSSSAFFENQREFERGIRDAQAELKHESTAKLDTTYIADIEAHFESMPERYFYFRDSDSVNRHIKLFRKFIRHTLNTSGFESLHPTINWEPFRNRGYSELELVCWNRQLLLAKVAGALASRKLNILSADIYSREDDLVLDVFRVCTTDFLPVGNESDQNAVQQLLNELLDNTTDVKKLGSKIPRQTREKNADTEIIETFPSRVVVSNRSNQKYTLLEVQVLDRIGLLYDIFLAIGASGKTEVQLSRICTEKGAAIDSFYLTNNKGEKIQDETELNRIADAIVEVIAVPDVARIVKV